MEPESNPPIVYVLEGGDEKKGGDGMNKGGRNYPSGLGGPGLKTNDEVLTEGVMPERGDKPLFAFRFLGVDVQRRELDADGNPVAGKDGEWLLLKLNEDYRPYVFVTGRSFEPEDPNLS